jgi:hypothetical protein
LGVVTVRVMVVGAHDSRLADDAGVVVRIARLEVCGDGLDRGDAAPGFR